MIPLKTHHQPSSSFFFSSISKPNTLHTISLQPHFLSLPQSPPLKFPLKFKPLPFSPSLPLQRVSKIELSICSNDEEFQDLSPKGEVYQKTLQLVECSMFAALTGLVYFLSNSLAIENYFSCFFSLPIVISSMRWGVDAGRKTLVATTILLFVLSGPVKALTYLLKHGIVGFTMGTLWRLETSWSLSIFLCTIVRSIGAVGFVLISSFLIRENILALITINIHASLTFVLTASGVNFIPSMNFIYTLFGILVLLNSGCFMFLLHMLYSVFLTRMGMKASLKLPRWLEKAI
ncbi:uncharacterized protein [Cicer arietinum]|uniref:Uncharacterized protein LOC101504306 n=1 Tax=Cicer arietinum TaxID=3827 RepID=A0A1S2XHR2_CICAR|nr:uncharacterized protein LOC101504306 [Cicer arietinum]XP_004489544.1 uncharacterized protein LOC101513327 [Cicer arietinum]